MRYADFLATALQSDELEGQVTNRSGAYTWRVNKWQQLKRFLILGSDAPTYYVKEQTLTRENAQVVLDCLAADPKRTLTMIAEVAAKGLAPKQQPYLFALALCCTSSEPVEVRNEAKALIPTVCRTGSQFLTFVSALDKLGSWTRSTKKAVNQWYLSREPDALAYQLVKYRNRSGWTHRDVLRMTHVKGSSYPEHRDILAWAAKGTVYSMPKLISDFELVQTLDPSQVPAFIVQSGLTHEMLPSEQLARPEVWNALLHHMPVGALVRNLGRLTSLGVIKDGNLAEKYVCHVLTNAEAIRKSQAHPLKLFVALLTYQQGRGDKGSLTWRPTLRILKALGDAIELACGNVKSTNKHIDLAIDVSRSMHWGRIAGMPMTPFIGAAVMAHITSQVEPNSRLYAFSSNYMAVKKQSTVAMLVAGLKGLQFDNTDCSLPMVRALAERRYVDAFVIYTDNETNAHHSAQPVIALQEYRNAVNPNAKLIVVGMTSDGFSIADPNDAGMIDVVGFDVDTPQLISSFIAEEY